VWQVVPGMGFQKFGPACRNPLRVALRLYFLNTTFWFNSLITVMVDRSVLYSILDITV